MGASCRNIDLPTRGESDDALANGQRSPLGARITSGINAKGHVTVHPAQQGSRIQSIDLKELVDQLQEAAASNLLDFFYFGFTRHPPPSRSARFDDAFARAITEYDYKGNYCCVYPIKVNQQRHVVEEILDFGKQYHFGLEAGSKPELLAVLALTEAPDTPIVCNGFKDDEFIKMTVLARKIGKQVIPIVEKFTELEPVSRSSQLQGSVECPASHRRARQARHARSGPVEVEPQAFGSKFGLTLSEVLELASRTSNKLRHGRLPSACALPHRQPDHQHPQHQGRLDRSGPDLCGDGPRSGAGVKYLDVGGRPGRRLRRLAIRLCVVGRLALCKEYANDVVFRIKNVCDEAEVPHPTIFSESGRAMVAYHSVWSFDRARRLQLQDRVPRRLRRSPRKPCSQSTPTCSGSICMS